MNSAPAHPFENLARRLYALEYPVLTGPGTPVGEDPGEDHIRWAVHVYVLCVVGHLRQLAESFGLLLRHGHRPTTFLVGRALFELAGHASLVAESVQRSLNEREYGAALKTLEAANMGNREMRESGQTTGDGREWVAPLHVMDDVRALSRWTGPGTRKEQTLRAERMYAGLAEFCHPNMAAFMQYAGFEQVAGVTRFRLQYAPHKHVARAEAGIAVITALVAINSLLGNFNAYPELAETLTDLREAFTREYNGIPDVPS